ncbi:30S ribosomal protein S6 [Sulfurihydrogenibium azorense]|jgi:small subunit ribosomal protein S6|uniref:Small ribosomal subunit protein bS6 n=1 Tax=Sulfurihydrogenibium azorense (strain DSM 15241 / OCM 825 / Az-Fu1) TaxID=204536 RepID=C1DTM8_SULAA|nr:30S ribosomal protein S6 [Sulfurihydrogenibium azorense]ACN99587.1 ribosomal protein S6 [Sulfurihydrogenibium azorense Az-Fu1]MDM7273640.1 30S ribosomal protein S6 [Sulfurihydrogenibium azorense]
MRHYELVFVLKPTLSEEELNSRVEAIQNLIKENQGEIYNLEKWGRRNLAYPIQKFNSGYYYLINYKTDNNKLAGILEYNLRITEDVIRFLNMKIHVKEDKKEVA